MPNACADAPAMRGSIWAKISSWREMALRASAGAARASHAFSRPWPAIERLSQNFAADQRENLRIVEGPVQLQRQRLPAVGEVSTLLPSTDSAGAGLALA